MINGHWLPGCLDHDGRDSLHSVLHLGMCLLNGHLAQVDLDLKYAPQGEVNR